jgi:hypothetical protein
MALIIMSTLFFVCSWCSCRWTGTSNSTPSTVAISACASPSSAVTSPTTPPLVTSSSAVLLHKYALPMKFRQYSTKKSYNSSTFPLFPGVSTELGAGSLHVTVGDDLTWDQSPSGQPPARPSNPGDGRRSSRSLGPTLRSEGRSTRRRSSLHHRSYRVSETNVGTYSTFPHNSTTFPYY